MQQFYQDTECANGEKDIGNIGIADGEEKATERTNMVIFPLPIDILTAFMGKGSSSGKS